MKKIKGKSASLDLFSSLAKNENSSELKNINSLEVKNENSLEPKNINSLEVKNVSEKLDVKRSYTLRRSTIKKLQELKVFYYEDPNVTYNEIVDEAIQALYKTLIADKSKDAKNKE